MAVQMALNVFCTVADFRNGLSNPGPERLGVVVISVIVPTVERVVLRITLLDGDGRGCLQWFQPAVCPCDPGTGGVSENVSMYRRWPSAKSVSKARELLPDPLKPPAQPIDAENIQIEILRLFCRTPGGGCRA